MKRSLSKVEKFLLTAMVLAGCFYLYLEKVYDPKMESHEKTLQEIQSLQKEIAGVSDTPGIGKMAAKVDDEKKQSQELNARLTDILSQKKAQSEADVSLVIKELKFLAVNSGLMIKELKMAQGGDRTTQAGVQKDAGTPRKNTVPSPEKNKNSPAGPEKQGNIPQLDPADLMEWQECMLVLEGGHSGLAGYVLALGGMRWCIVIKNIEVKANEDTGDFRIAMTVLI